MLFSGSWVLEMMESLVSFQNSTILDFFKDEPNLREQNPVLIIPVMILSSISPFLLKIKPKESEEIKNLRNQKNKNWKFKH